MEKSGNIEALVLQEISAQLPAEYKVFEFLGEGGHGIVLKAMDLTLQRSVTLKIMKTDGSESTAKQTPAAHQSQARVRVLLLCAAACLLALLLAGARPLQNKQSIEAAYNGKTADKHARLPHHSELGRLKEVCIRSEDFRYDGSYKTLKKGTLILDDLNRCLAQLKENDSTAILNGWIVKARLERALELYADSISSWRKVITLCRDKSNAETVDACEAYLALGQFYLNHGSPEQGKEMLLHGIKLEAGFGRAEVAVLSVPKFIDFRRTLFSVRGDMHTELSHVFDQKGEIRDAEKEAAIVEELKLSDLQVEEAAVATCRRLDFLVSLGEVGRARSLLSRRTQDYYNAAGDKALPALRSLEVLGRHIEKGPLAGYAPFLRQREKELEEQYGVHLRD